jgi:transcriptional regulator with XRE-family HTH domain
MVTRPGPTLRRRKLVKELIAAREGAGLSLRQLAAEIDVQPGTLSKIEKGVQGLTVRNIKAIARATSLSKTKTDDLVLLAADLAETDWLVEFGDREDRLEWFDWFELYPKLEQDAVQIWNYGPELPHGLVQIPEYAEEMARVAFPDITDEQLRQSLELRANRQELLDRDEPPHLRLIFNEAVVRREVGGATVLRRQLLRLLELSARPSISVQVVPFSAGAHPGMKAGFTLLRFPEGFDDMDCVYLENENGSVWQEVPEHVVRYTTLFERLSSQALSPDETAELLASLV